MQDVVIETRSLCKKFGAVEAVRDFNLSVPRGSIFGFLGRNGAGKTTTMKVLLGMTAPGSGEGFVLGHRIDNAKESLEIRRRTGFISEDASLYDYFTVEQMIRFTRSFYPGWRKDLEEKYLQLFDLPKNRKVKALSKGMRTKMALLLAFSQGAELLILDEPTHGLDPVMDDEVLQAIVSLTASEGMTIFFSSHQIHEVDQIADHVCIINHGRAIIQCELDFLKENYRRLNVMFVDDAPVSEFASDSILRIKHDNHWLSMLVSSDSDKIAEKARSLNAVSVEILPVSLREIFLEMVRQEENSGEIRAASEVR